MTKMMVIGDETVISGMKLAGLKNCAKADEENIFTVLKEIPKDIDIIVISGKLRQKAKDTIIRMKDKMVIELPDGEEGGEDMVARMIRDVIGFETS